MVLCVDRGREGALLGIMKKIQIPSNYRFGTLFPYLLFAFQLLTCAFVHLLMDPCWLERASLALLLTHLVSPSSQRTPPAAPSPSSALAHISICRVAPSSRRDCAPSGAPLRRSSSGPTGRSLPRRPQSIVRTFSHPEKNRNQIIA